MPSSPGAAATMPEALAEDDILLLSGKIDFYWIIAACRVRVAALLGGGYHCSLPLSRASRQVLVAPHGGSPIANAFFRKRIFYEGIDSDIEFRLFKEQLFGGEESFYEAVRLHLRRRRRNNRRLDLCR
jgi:hypothetical protein